MTPKRLIKISFIALLIIYGCSKVPLTGRKQLHMLPETSLISLSLTTYNNFLNSHKLSNDTKNSELVKKVGTRIANAVKLFLKQQHKSKLIKDYKWEFNLIEDNTPNAWCMPGGKVVVYTGILPYTKNENGLAVVLGHEIAHAIARHGNERMSQQLLYQLGGMSLAVAMKEKPQETQKLFMTAYAITGQVGILLPYSRLHETEADKLGLVFMAMAGYDPRNAIEFWERMKSIGGQKPPEFLSTHPSDEKRIKNIKEFLPEALKYYKPNS